jgi:hypothetical protein
MSYQKGITPLLIVGCIIPEGHNAIDSGMHVLPEGHSVVAASGMYVLPEGHNAVAAVHTDTNRYLKNVKVSEDGVLLRTQTFFTLSVVLV